MSHRVWVLGLVVLLGGCSGLRDVPKTIWGSSTRVLEDARTNALTKTYDKGYWDCFRAAVDVVEDKGYVMFKKDAVRGYMVIMGIPGSVNTTEVGVFFVENNDQQTRIELSSLSTNAKRLLAKSLFHGMDVAFGLAVADKEEGFVLSEFEGEATPEGLIKTIERDGYSVPFKKDALTSLNIFLENEKFHDDWMIKHKDIPLPKEASDLLAMKDKTKDQIKRMNRLILQETYPSVPKIKQETVPEADNKP